MRSTRRDFIKSLGIAIASLVMARCIPSGDEGDSAGGEDDSPQARLRSCWLQLDWLAQETREAYERGDQARGELIADHRAALDDLVAAGELDAAVADELDIAFSAATSHVFLASGAITCYTAMPPPDYSHVPHSQLVRQADLLAEMAESGDLDPATVAQAQAAIERDITFLKFSYKEKQALYDELREAAGDTYDFPSFDELDLEVSSETAEAARFLVELLSEE